MKSEFETLEQYQDSMKKFNENTRIGFENFIQSHGSDRNKLQLRCTPYTDKKGGYGSLDLDFGLSLWQHQQSKIDELTKQRDSFIKAYEIEMDESVELQKRIDDLKSFCIKGVESNMLSIEYNQALIDMHKILKGDSHES